jgi:hypothetical protein
MTRLGNFYDSKHTYQLGTESGDILVDANNRDQARRVAERAGYVVRDVNMVG